MQSTEGSWLSRETVGRAVKAAWAATLLWTTTVEGRASAEEEVVELRELTVRSEEAGLAAGGASMAGGDVVELGRTGRQTEGSLGEALSWEPGLSSSFYGAGASRPMVRGMGGHRVGVYTNGLSSGDLSSRSPDHAVAIEPVFVREVVVHRGAAALIHGGGAIGGAVDTQADYLSLGKVPVPGWSGEAGGSFSTQDDGRMGYLKAGHGSGNWELRVNALTRETEDYTIPGKARTEAYDINNRLRLPPEVQGQVAPNPEGTVPNTWTRTGLIAIGAGWRSENLSTRAGYQHFTGEYGVPLDGHTHGNPFGTPGVNGPGVGDGIRVEFLQDRGTGAVTLLPEAEWFESVELRGALTHFRQEEWEGAFLSNDFRQETAEALAEAPMFFGDWSLLQIMGLRRERYTNRNISYSAGRADEDFLETIGSTISWAGMVERDWGGTKFRLGSRFEWHHAAREDLSAVDSTEHAFSTVAEVRRPLPGNWEARLSLGRLVRIPTPEERFIEAPHGATGVYQIPNTELATEVARSVELVLARETADWGFSINLFRREFDGFIFLENRGFEVGGLTAYAHVQRKARFQGGELRLRATLLQTEAASLTARGFFDWVEARDTGNDEPLPRIPPKRLGGSLEARTNGWFLAVDTLHSFAQEDVPRRIFGTLAFQSPTESYTLVNARLQHTFELFRATAQAEIRATNLLDAEARQHTSFLKDVAPLPGRGLEIRVSLEF